MKKVFVGLVYGDPAGIWEVLEINGDFAEIKLIKDKAGNDGFYTSVPINEIEYYLNCQSLFGIK